MDDPIFRMRAKVAQRAGGHAFEERFLKLNGLQLAIAYKQAIKEENEKFEFIKAMNSNWSKKFDNLFKILFMYTNPKMYASVEEMKELNALREEVKAEEFPEIWDEIMQVIPEQIIVEDVVPESNTIPSIDPETEQMLAGFVPYRGRKDGE